MEQHGYDLDALAKEYSLRPNAYSGLTRAYYDKWGKDWTKQPNEEIDAVRNEWLTSNGYDVD